MTTLNYSKVYTTMHIRISHDPGNTAIKWVQQFVGTTTHEREGKEMGETSYISHTCTCTGYTCLEAEAQCLYMYM